MLIYVICMIIKLIWGNGDKRVVIMDKIEK